MDGKPTVLSWPTWLTACVYVVCLLAGTGIGRLVVPLADWLVTLPWAPMQGPAELVASIPAVWPTVAGAAAGLALALIARHERLVIRLTDEHVILASKGEDQEFPRESVAAVFRDGGDLVLLGHDSGELARRECDLDAGRVADAFTAHGYAWTATDPHRDAFTRWVSGAPGLPQGANTLLKERQRLLKDKGPSHDEVRELREELSHLGVVVRDEQKRQYWRTFPAT